MTTDTENRRTNDADLTTQILAIVRDMPAEKKAALHHLVAAFYGRRSDDRSTPAERTEAEHAESMSVDAFKATLAAELCPSWWHLNEHHPFASEMSYVEAMKRMAERVQALGDALSYIRSGGSATIEIGNCLDDLGREGMLLSSLWLEHADLRITATWSARALEVAA